MERTNFDTPENERVPSLTLRDLMRVAFRHRQLVTLCFLGVLAAAILAAILLPEQYEARMKILVKHERVDAVVTSERNATPQQLSNSLVTEEDLNSEVELIKSRDLLEKVVETCGLDASPPSFWDFLHPNSAAEKDLRIARAVHKLDHRLKVGLAEFQGRVEIIEPLVDLPFL